MLDRRDLLKLGFSAAAGLRMAVAAPVSAAPVRKLLLVHGRGQQGLDPQALKSEWMATLARGATAIGQTVPADLDVSFPFYGDALDKFAQQSEIPLTSDIRARGSGQQEHYLEFQAEIATAIAEQAGVTDEQISTEYGTNPTPRGPQNWEWVQAILRAIDKHGGGLGQSTLETFTRDVFLYTTLPGVQDEIDRIVVNALTDEPTVVVAHSLGTIVAYHILRTDPRRLQIPLLVTVGSPLAIRAIRRQFLPLRYPPVGAWYNAFDPKDVVALYPLDNANFPVQPGVENYNQVHNSTDNHHGIVGYLDNPDVAGRIVRALGG